MINLLPEERKREFRAARVNVLLLRYNFLTLSAVAIIAVLCAGTFVILQASKQSAQAAISENEARTSSLSDVRKDADTYRQDLTLASKILGNETSYTDTIIAITNLMPRGTVLDGLALGGANATTPSATAGSTAGQQIVFQAQAKNFSSAEALKCHFEQSPLFTDVYFQGLSKDVGETKSDYPIKVSMNAKLNMQANLEQQAQQKKDGSQCKVS